MSSSFLKQTVSVPQWQLGAGAVVAALGGVGVWKAVSIVVRHYWPLRGHPEFKEERLLKQVLERSERGNPESVLKEIDHFGWNQQFLMNVGDRKGAILDEAIRERKPRIMLELGAYCGYSAVRIARLLPVGGKLYSVELDPLHAAIAARIVHHAGLSHKVEFIVGKISDEKVLNQLKEFGVSSFDAVFIDHHKAAYKPDLILMENRGLVAAGTRLIADNVIFPGAPDYLEYVRSKPDVYETKLIKSNLEYSDVLTDGLEISTRLK